MKTQINDELKHKKAFTLVELIIVITILVILATIAFVSFQNYTKDSRDANRLTTINNISKGLDVFQIKTGFYPEPENKTSFTGAGDKKLHQGIISDNITNTINLSEIPLDPKEKTNYIYSTYGDGKYYQIASEAENITSFLYNTTYAENKSSIVIGNYKFDPSLPSLVVIPNSLTGSSIFDPKVCFVTNGGVNNITSSSGNCLKKEEMSLNTIDNSLVGYWDMESLCENGNCGVGNDGKLKDLSGNENYGVGSGGIVVGGVNGRIGKETLFNSGTLQHFIISETSSLTFFPKGITLSLIFKTSIWNKGVFLLEKSGSGSDNKFNWYNYGIYSRMGKKQLYGYFVNSMTGITNSSLCTGTSNNGLYDCMTTPGTINGNYDYDNNEYFYIHSTFDGKLGKFYINGKLINEKVIGKQLSIRTASGNILIGKDSTYNSFHGIIDEVKIYNRALSDQEIAQQARIAGF